MKCSATLTHNLLPRPASLRCDTQHGERLGGYSLVAGARPSPQLAPCLELTYSGWDKSFSKIYKAFEKRQRLSDACVVPRVRARYTLLVICTWLFSRGGNFGCSGTRLQVRMRAKFMATVCSLRKGMADKNKMRTLMDSENVAGACGTACEDGRRRGHQGSKAWSVTSIHTL
jgi:hypothetical protein